MSATIAYYHHILNTYNQRFHENKTWSKNIQGYRAWNKRIDIYRKWLHSYKSLNN